MPGTLYLVATPIGNLEDISPRALRVLGAAALVAAEDTRVTRRLLSHFGIRAPMVSCHARNEPARLPVLLQTLRDGGDVALVTDRGTPCVSDPGGRVVRAAAAEGIRVTPIPGPSAVPAALSASGLDASRFVFEGFLPRTRSEARRRLRAVRDLPHTLVLFEAANRLAGTLSLLREELGDRPCVVAREISKLHEEFHRGTLSDALAWCDAAGPRGEVVLIVAGRDDSTPAPPDGAGAPGAAERLDALLAEGVSPRDAARQVAAETGIPRRELYGRAIRARSKS